MNKSPLESTQASAHNLQKVAARTPSLSSTTNNKDKPARLVKPEPFLGTSSSGSSSSSNFANSSARLPMRPDLLPLLTSATSNTGSSYNMSGITRGTFDGTGAGLQASLKPPEAAKVDPRLWQQHCTAQRQYWTGMEKEAVKMARGGALGSFSSSPIANNVPPTSPQLPYITPYWSKVTPPSPFTSLNTSRLYPATSPNQMQGLNARSKYDGSLTSAREQREFLLLIFNTRNDAWFGSLP